MAGNGCFVLNKVKVNDKTAMIRTENPFACQRNMINMTHCSEYVYLGAFFTGNEKLKASLNMYTGVNLLARCLFAMHVSHGLESNQCKIKCI